MKSIVTTAAAFCLLTAAAASAQTVQHAVPAPAASPAAASAAAASSPTPAATLPMAQSTPSAAPVTSLATPRAVQAPAPGANSFTESEARSRITSHGFANVVDLKKDAQGIWRAAAQKDGKPVTVALDFEGNVIAR